MHKRGVRILDTLDKILDELSKTSHTQKELCEYLGIGKQAFSDWKSHKSNSYLKYLPQIAEFFNVSVDYLLGKNNEVKEKNAATEDDELSEYLEELKTRPEMKMLFSLAKGATKEDVEQAVAIIEALRKTKNG